MNETQEPESTPLEPNPNEGTDPSPKPEPDPVQEVNDDELNSLEGEGESNVNEMSPQEAAADDTVDDEENDVPPPTSPTQQQGADPGVSS